MRSDLLAEHCEEVVIEKRFSAVKDFHAKLAAEQLRKDLPPARRFPGQLPVRTRPAKLPTNLPITA